MIDQSFIDALKDWAAKDANWNTVDLDFYTEWWTTYLKKNSKLDNVVSLNLYQKWISNIWWISAFVNLENVNLMNNPVQEIPTEIWTLTKLKKLAISNWSLTSIPTEIWNLTNLK